MSEYLNPYQAPDADLNAPKPTVSNSGLTETMIKYLKQASPWIRFIGILSFIGCGLMGLIGIGVMIAIPFITGFSNIYTGILGSALGMIYIIIGVIMFFPARFTYYYGTSIRNFIQSNSEQDLEAAFKNNKSLWKFYGILCIVYIAFLPIAIIVSIIPAIASIIF